MDPSALTASRTASEPVGDEGVLRIVPGRQFPVEVDFLNRRDRTVTVIAELTGVTGTSVTPDLPVDDEWDQPTFVLEPGERLDAYVPFVVEGPLLTGSLVACVTLRDAKTNTALHFVTFTAEVDDIAQVSVSIEPSRSRGLLRSKASVILDNHGTNNVSIRLEGNAPGRLFFEFPNPEVTVGGQDTCTSPVIIRRPARWFGAPVDHVFAVNASSAGRAATGSATFTQRAVVPAALAKAVAGVVVIIALLAAGLWLVRHIVDDSTQFAWTEVTDPEDPLAVGRAGHTVTPIRGALEELGLLGRLEATVFGDDRSGAGFLVVGGASDDRTLAASVMRYDTSSQSWLETTPPELSAGVVGHVTVATDDRAVVIGGVTGGEGDGVPLLQFDAVERRWHDLPTPPSNIAALGHGAVWSDGALYVFGGLASDGAFVPEQMMVLRHLTENDDPSNLSSAQWFFAGQGVSDPREQPPATGDGGPPSWPDRDGPPPRAGHAMAAVGRYVVISGGMGVDGALLSDVWTFDTVTQTWSEHTPGLPSARMCHQMVSVGELVAVVGGTGGSDDGPAGWFTCDAVIVPAAEGPPCDEDDAWPLARRVGDAFVDAACRHPWAEPGLDPTPVVYSVMVGERPGAAPTVEIVATGPGVLPDRVGLDFAAGRAGNDVVVVMGLSQLETVAIVTADLDDRPVVLPVAPRARLGLEADTSVGFGPDGVMVWGGSIAAGTGGRSTTDQGALVTLGAS